MFFTQEDYRKIEEYLKLNARKDTDFELLDSGLIGPNDVIAVVHDTKNRKIRLQDIFLSKVYEDLYELQRNEWAEKVAELQDMINNLKINKVHITDTFGDSDIAGVSLKTLTSAFNKIWEKLEDITGEIMLGINMVVTPDYFISEDGCNVNIKANTVETNGIFEHIAFYGNGVLIAEASNVDYFEHNFHIDETTVVQCVAKIMGVEYTRQSVITHYSSFLFGSGDTYADFMDANNRFLPQYAIPITNGMRGAYDVNVAEGKRIIIVVGKSLAAGFIRADLNGVEIQFTESTCTDADGKVYKVFTSEPWVAGDYNIDING